MKEENEKGGTLKKLNLPCVLDEDDLLTSFKKNESKIRKDEKMPLLSRIEPNSLNSDQEIVLRTNPSSPSEFHICKLQDEVGGLGKVIYHIGGLDCNICALSIEKALQSITGIVSCSVNLLSLDIMVIYDVSLITDEQIMEQIRNLGLSVKGLVHQPDLNMITLKLRSKDTLDLHMLKYKLLNVNGVDSVLLYPKNSRITITHNAKLVGVREILEKITQEKIEAFLEENSVKEDKSLKKRRTLIYLFSLR